MYIGSVINFMDIFSRFSKNAFKIHHHATQKHYNTTQKYHHATQINKILEQQIYIYHQSYMS